MVIEFDAVIQDDQEYYDREVAEEMGGISSVSFFRKKDKIVTVAINMTNILEYREGTVYVNDEEKICTYGVTKKFKTTNPLLITVVEFKELFEKANSVKVHVAHQLLN